MAVALKQALSQNGSRAMQRWQGARKKMMTAAEWGKQLSSLFSIILAQKYPWIIPAIHSEEGTAA
jgi:hypothetical protein